MKTLFKVVGGILLVLLLLVGAVAAYLTWFFNPNDYKGQVEKSFAESTGRKLTMGGDLELTLFPWLGFSVKEVSVSNPPGFGEQPFARTASAQARVLLLPLLKRRVEVGKVKVDGLELHLIRDEKGRTNWRDFGGRAKAGEAAPADKAEPGPGMAVEVSGVEVSHSRVTWEDRKSKARYEVFDVNLTLGNILPGAPMDLEMGFSFQGQKPRLDSKVQLSGKVLARPDSRQYEVAGFQADVSATGDFSGNREVKGQLGGDVKMDQAKDHLAVDNLSFALAGLTGTGNFQADNLSKAMAFSGALKASTDNLKQSLENLGIQISSRDPKALGAVRVDLSFSGNPQAVEFKPVTCTLDDTRLTGSARAVLSRPNAYTFALLADILNADRYLPPKQPGTQGKQPGPQAPSGQKKLSGLKNLSLDGKLEVGKLTFSGLEMKDVLVQVTAKNGVLSIEPARSNLYGGSTLAQVRMDVTGNEPRLAVKDDTRTVQLGALLPVLTGKNFLTGLGTVKTDLTARGLTTPELLKTLAGTLSVSVSDGMVKGVNLAQIIRDATAALKGKLPAGREPQETDFARLTATVLFANGKASNQDLLLDTPILRVTGRGIADLLQRHVDYTLSAAVLGDLRVTVAGVEKNLKNIQIPIRVTGSLDHPRFRVDPLELARALAGEEIEKKKGEVEKKMEEMIQKNLPPAMREDAGKKARKLLDSLIR